MSGEDGAGVMPKLRFPEFREAEGWESKKLASFLTESRVLGSRGNTARKLTVKLWGRGVSEKNEKILGSENTKYYRRKGGQFIYSKLDFLNQAFGVIPSHLDGLESTVDLPCFDISNQLNPTFLLEYVQRDAFYKRNGEIADGGRKAKRIQVEDFLEFEIDVPPKRAEQQKIAECLSSLDAVIAAEGERLVALKDHKKGMMQTLFPAPGQTSPRLRFPEFEGRSEWVEKPLGEIATYENGKAYEPHIVETGKYVVVNASFISTDGVKRKYSNHPMMIADQDDILMVLSDLPNGKALAKCFRVDTGGTYAVNQRIARLKPHSINSAFLFAALNRNRRLLSFNDGMNQTHLSKGNVLDCPIVYPSDESEQAAIASSLASIETELRTEIEKLAALKLHKKALMQQLFPLAAEVRA